MSEAMGKWIYLTAGWVALGLGVAGIFLPVLPTTPFVLLAAWCFSRSSEQLHRWLLDHPRFGPLIRDWEAHRVIRLRAKILATAVILPLIGYTLLVSGAPVWSKALTAVLALFGLTFVWTRPSRPPSTDSPEPPGTSRSSGSLR